MVRRFNRFTALIALSALIFVALLMSGCSSNEKVPDSTPSPALLTPTPIAEVYDPISYEQTSIRVNNTTLVFPKVNKTPAADAINKSIEAGLRTHLAHNTAITNVSFNITFNSGGLFSFVSRMQDDKQQFSFLPFVYDVNTGRSISLPELFKQDSQWREAMIEQISISAQTKNVKLIKNITTIEDDCMYYITPSSIVIIYEVYEVATYSSGMPLLTAPYESYSQFLDTDGYGYALYKAANAPEKKSSNN